MGHRVLVVDDVAGLRMTLAANLELDGFDVVEAENGAEALARAREQDFDVVLTDIRMPGMSGVELFRQLRRLRPGLPVVLMTAFTIENLIRDALREGAYMVVAKPFNVERVSEALKRAVDRPLVCVVDQGGEAMVGALAAVGLSALAVTSEAEAVAMVQAGQVGVCVVDLSMPAMDGPDLLGRLSAIDPDLVFIALSGDDVDHLVRRAAAHADSILKKPVPARDLVEAIARARTPPAR
jgi:CheY-like chemotaxis protein